MLRAENVYSFVISNNLFGDELWTNLVPKIKSEIKMESYSLQLYGVIDQIYLYGDECVPIELKTGKMPKEGVWPNHRIQLTAYALLLEDYLNQSVKEGYIRYLDSNQTRRISINPMMRDEVIKLIAEVTNVLSSKTLPDFCSNFNKCEKCGLRQQCYDKNKMSELMNKRYKQSL